MKYITQQIKLKKSMLFQAFCFVSLLLLTLQTNLTTISSSLNINQTYKSFTRDISMVGEGQTLNIHFEVTSANQMTSTFLKVSTEEPVKGSKTRVNSYYGKDPLDHEEVDLDAMWEFRDQFINIEKEDDDEDTLYMTVFNFDPSYRSVQPVEFQITIAYSGEQSCRGCPKGENFNEYCSCNCQVRSGKSCSRFIEQVKNSELTRVINARSIYYFSVSPTIGSYIKMNITIEEGFGEAYFQFITFEDEVAAYLNAATTSKGDGAVYNLIAGESLSIEASLAEKSFSIAIANFNHEDVNLYLSYTVTDGVNVLVIVLAVLGGLLLVILIVAAVCIVKKSQNHRVMSEVLLPSAEATKLNSEEIQRFFPEAFLRELISPSQNSDQPSLNNLQNRIPDSDCVICLQKMQLEDPVRIAYCRHIFHSKCLIQWFKKQRTCPYCRKQYSRKNTLEDYEKLMQENQNKVLKNLTLMQAIYYSNPKVSIEQ